MRQTNDTFKDQFFRFFTKVRSSYTVAKNVVNVSDADGLRRDFQRAFQDMLIEALAWTKHHAMFAKKHRPGIAKAREMVDFKNIHPCVSPVDYVMPTQHARWLDADWRSGYMSI